MSTPPHLRDTDRRGFRRSPLLLGLAVVLIVAFFGLKASAVVIPAGHRGVVFDRIRGGVQQKVLGEGLNLVNPFTASVTLFDVRSQTYTMSNAADEGQVEGADGVSVKTYDGQNVEVDVSLRYHVDPAKVAELYQQIGLDYENKVVLPTIRSTVRDIFSEHPADAVYSANREEIAEELTRLVETELQPRGILVDEFLLRNIEFTPEYFAAIENKQVEQQTSLRKTYELEIAEKEAEVRRIKAEGEARANDIRGAALKANPRVVQYDYLRKVAPNVQALIVDSQDLKHGTIAPPAGANR